ncbi:ISL3 family transposase [Nonomuraea sp. NPDC059007]|uniref:ISL3 family transposase n=1 Tax=Nonomuraea sp. NPDC059007 TaxID=3346692 RepID=UPI00369DF21B
MMIYLEMGSDHEVELGLTERCDVLAEVRWLRTFLPQLAELVVWDVIDRGSHVLIRARTMGKPAGCSRCGKLSSRVHGRYRRLLQDLPAGGRRVLIDLSVRRLICQNALCEVRTFAESAGALAGRYERNTGPLRRMLESFALALAARPGSRLAEILGVTVSRDTLIRLVRALSDPEIGRVTVLGVDDFAKRRGNSYATLLIDMDTHRPIEVLDGRGGEALAQWLEQHPGVEVICRDRAGAYAEGAQIGAPLAIEVADRWHLWKNVCDAAEATIRAHRADLREPEPEAESEIAEDAVHITSSDSVPETRIAARTRERHAAVHALVADGRSVAEICRILDLSHKTVRRFRAATTADELVHKRGRRRRPFQDFLPYLHQRITEDGVANGAQLFAEITALGYDGSRRTVRRYLEPFRCGAPHRTSPVLNPTVREVTRWVTSHPDHLTDDEKDRLAAILERSPQLTALDKHVTAFAQMMANRTGRIALKPWLAEVEADDIPRLHSLARGLRSDQTAVTNGLSLPYSSGPVEGNVTRVKALKRSRYGRANLDLLRKLILHAH